MGGDQGWPMLGWVESGGGLRCHWPIGRWESGWLPQAGKTLEVLLKRPKYCSTSQHNCGPEGPHRLGPQTNGSKQLGCSRQPCEWGARMGRRGWEIERSGRPVEGGEAGRDTFGRLFGGETHGSIPRRGPIGEYPGRRLAEMNRCDVEVPKKRWFSLVEGGGRFLWVPL